MELAAFVGIPTKAANSIDKLLSLEYVFKWSYDFWYFWALYVELRYNDPNEFPLK